VVERSLRGFISKTYQHRLRLQRTSDAHLSRWEDVVRVDYTPEINSRQSAALCGGVMLRVIVNHWHSQSPSPPSMGGGSRVWCMSVPAVRVRTCVRCDRGSGVLAALDEEQRYVLISVVAAVVGTGTNLLVIMVCFMGNADTRRNIGTSDVRGRRRRGLKGSEMAAARERTENEESWSKLGLNTITKQNSMPVDSGGP
jgi:hypothetical protein